MAETKVTQYSFDQDNTVAFTNYLRGSSSSFSRSTPVTETQLPSRTDINLDKKITPQLFQLAEQETNGARSEAGIQQLKREAALVILDRVTINSHGVVAERGTKLSSGHTFGKLAKGNVIGAIRDGNALRQVVDAIGEEFSNRVQAGKSVREAHTQTSANILNGKMDELLGTLPVNLARDVMSRRPRPNMMDNEGIYSRTQDIATSARVADALGKDYVVLSYTGHIRDLDMPYTIPLASRPVVDRIVGPKVSVEPAPV